MITYKDASFFLGKTIDQISYLNDEVVTFETSDGKKYRMFHDQDCCETVKIHDIVGELESIVGSPLIRAEEESIQDIEDGDASNWPADVPVPAYLESYSWITYWFETAKGKVRIRWCGESNGYYSEAVQIEEIK